MQPIKVLFSLMRNIFILGKYIALKYQRETVSLLWVLQNTFTTDSEGQPRKTKLKVKEKVQEIN